MPKSSSLRGPTSMDGVVDSTAGQKRQSNRNNEKSISNENDNIEHETISREEIVNAVDDVETGFVTNGYLTMEELDEAFDSKQKEISETFNPLLGSAIDSGAFESAFNAKFESKFEAILESKLASGAFEAAFESRFESAFKIAYEKELEKDDPEGKYPRDCYSFVALGPNRRNYFLPFFFGCMVFLFQVVLLGLMLFSKTYFFTSKWQGLSQNEDIDNPDQSKQTFNGGSFIPANASIMVRMTQFVAVLAFVIIGGDSLNDFTEAVMDFPRSYNRKYAWLQVACVLRGLQGLLACVTAILLVVTDDDVIDIVLNFAAIHFISTFDDTAYQLAESGCYGRTLKEETEKIKSKKLPSCILRSMNPLCSESMYLITVTILGIVLMTIVTLVTIFGEHSHFWMTRLMRVEFGEEGLHDYSGCFEITDFEHNRRKAYRSYNLRDNLTASLAYCQRTRGWVFHTEGPAIDPCDLTGTSSELAHSSKTSSFDISTATENTWFSLYDVPLAVHFLENEENVAEKDFFSCDVHVGDGLCDQELNTFIYQYDGGDCCATSCARYEFCGTGSVLFESAFGEENINGYGFPFTCEDPNVIDGTELVSVDIHLDEIVERGNSTPYLNLFCMIDTNQVQFFSIPLDKAMEGNKQTIDLKDGLECSLSIEMKLQNNTIGTASDSFDVKYRVFPVLQRHVDTFTGDIGTNWNLGVYQGDTDTKKEFAVYSGYSKSSVELDLTEYQIHGTIPNEIGVMSSLKSIALGEGNVYGSIPSEIGLLTSLTSINFESNEIDGRLPTELGLLTLLEELNVNENWLQGSIPNEIGYLTSLTDINLRLNTFVGQIPTEIGLLTSLAVFNFAGNKLNGDIPTEVGLLTTLTFFQLDLNFLEGSILSEIGRLTSVKHMDLADNLLTGEIPSEIGLLTSLTYLTFDDNLLQGTIPSQINLLTSLTTFYAYLNQLTGLIATEIGLLTSLTSLALHDNEFEGSIPTEIGILTDLEFLILASNDLTGEIPTEIGLLTSLKYLYLNDNKLEGALPSELGLLTSLLNLRLGSNFFTGEIPCELQEILPYLDEVDEFVDLNNGTLLEDQEACLPE